MGIFGAEREGIDGVTLTLAITIGVAAGTLLGGLALWKIAEHQMSQAAALAQSVLRSQAEAARLDEQRSVQARAAAEAVRVRELAAAQRADAAQRAESLAEAERKEEAWRKFYRPSPGCGGAAVSVECSNEFIRAKRSFEDKRARGEL